MSRHGQGFEEVERTNMDAVLLTKEWACSMELSQQPILLLPKTYLNKLPRVMTVLPRNKLSARQVSEFLKTAMVVEADPWLLQAAGDYLRGWVYANYDARHEDPEVPTFALSRIDRISAITVKPSPDGCKVNIQRLCGTVGQCMVCVGRGIVLRGCWCGFGCRCGWGCFGGGLCVVGVAWRWGGDVNNTHTHTHTHQSQQPRK